MRPDSKIRKAYDPERFRTNGHRLIDALADHLARAQRREGVVVPWRHPAESREAWATQLRQPPTELVGELERIVAASTTLAHPHCLAHQVSAPLPDAALSELASSLLNNGMGVYEMGPAGVPIELAVVQWMCDRLGMPAGASGFLTSGGSLGNLTALLAMRQVATHSWVAGTDQPLAIVCSADAHYSVSRAIAIMGWGEGGAIAAELDTDHHMTAANVERALASPTARGRTVIGIVASAGSTATGAFDPLEDLAAVAKRHRLWLHVDAAHGGSYALSARERHRLRGIEHADSVVWDAHKMMMMPALVTAVLFRRGNDARAAFSQQASYLFSEDEPWWDLGTRTFECTKRMMAIEIWTTLRVHGEAWFGEVVEHLADSAKLLANKLAAAPDFELALVPESNIVCYRHLARGLSGAALDEHNRALRQRVAEDGRFYLVGTQLGQGYFLRSTLMNPLVEERDLDGLIAHLRMLAGG